MSLAPIISLLWVLFFIGVVVAVILVILWFVQTILEIPIPQRALRVVWGLVALLLIIWLLMWLSGSVHLSMPGMQ